MDVPIGFGDGIDAKQAVLASLLEQVRCSADQPLPFNAAIDHHMRDVETLRPEFAGHTLRKHPQTRLRRGKMRKTRFPTQASGCARENKGSTA
jgi:hypothetical protein